MDIQKTEKILLENTILEEKPLKILKKQLSFEKKEYSEISEEDYCIKTLKDAINSGNAQSQPALLSSDLSPEKTLIMAVETSNKMLADYKRKRKAENLSGFYFFKLYFKNFIFFFLPYIHFLHIY